MNPFLASFMFAAGSGAWIYSKMQRRNGGLTQQSLAVAGGAALAAFVVFLTIFSTLFSE